MVADALELATVELRRIAERSGCTVLSESSATIGGLAVPVLELVCPGNAEAILFLNGAAYHDAAHPVVRDAAFRLRALAPSKSTRDVASTVQAWVQGAIPFVRERDETFQHSLVTAALPGGDCDDHARLVCSLLTAAGLRARIVGVPNREGQISHVCAEVHDAGKWNWVETTVPAAYDEAPFDAAQRLRVDGREDLGGLTSGGRLVLGAGERVRLRLLVTESGPSFLARGGTLYVQHLLEDLGLRDVHAYAAPPASWLPRAQGAATFPDFLVWAEGTSSSESDFQADLDAHITVTDAWPAPWPGASSSRSSLTRGAVWMLLGGAFAVTAAATVVVVLRRRRR